MFGRNVDAMDDDRLGRALAAIDAANADDPNRITVRGAVQPKELAHAELVTEWVDRLTPDPSDALLLAARAHHLRRWTIPRAEYPQGRSGYLRWRNALHDQHAADVAEILAAEGFDTDTIERVQRLVRKDDLGFDPEAQVLEDALCLVFLETQFHDLAARLDPAKLARVVDKTLAKMSSAAIDLAQTLDLPDADRTLLVAALGGEGGDSPTA
jgi:Domain of unknown function (DUF4202)